jgi:predicted negative regulator of RcsB-dependent stress response
MATSLDLQDQEQLDALKAFWKQYGNLVTWVLILALGGFAAWNGWNWWQRDQATKAGAMFDELDRAATAGDADKAGRVFGDLKERYPRTAFAQQGGLAAGKAQFDRGQVDAAKASLTWVATHAIEDEYRTVARLRLAGLLVEQYDEALKMLDEAKSPAFEALVADRRGDVLLAQGKPDQARTAFQAAWAGMDEKLDYRRLIEAKLVALAAAPTAPASGASK